ncbi:PAS domain-containing sensor histidine kinase [Pseudomonas sp. G11-1]|nr:PAS domain-containing sensor histidine kinase [Pseudomonas sp. G11-1]MCO5790072.1 PAS domain-containing sensor histidine kinase [Pseudomonas sp. G11-2]
MNWFRSLDKQTRFPDQVAVADVVLGKGYYLQLDHQGCILDASAELRRLFPDEVPSGVSLSTYLAQPSAEIYGSPDTWPAQLSSIVLHGRRGQLLYFQGGLLPQGDGWLLFLLDNTAMVLRLQLEERRRQILDYSVHQALRMREAEPERMQGLTVEWLEGLRLRLQIPWLGLLLPGPRGWSLYAHASLPDAPPFSWHSTDLHQLLLDTDKSVPQTWHCRVSHESAWLVPYREHDGVRVWLVVAGVDSQRQAPFFSEADWVGMLMLFAAPLSSGVRYLQVQQSLRRNSVLQRVMDIGWWEYDSDTQRVSMAPNLADTMGLELSAEGDLGLEESLVIFDPVDREQVLDRLRELLMRGEGASESICLQVRDGRHWYRLSGEVVGRKTPKVVGYTMDISDLRRQEAQTAAARARLEGLLDNAPAVIFIQSYIDGALAFEFCSASLYQLLGWTLSDWQHNSFSSFLHPEDRQLYYERTRTLLQTGYTSSRYRVRDCHGAFHWVLDEAKLLRDERGMPTEVVGLLMDVTEATEASESVRKSEERYRILVEDSPAIICRYLPDLTLTFANKPMVAALGLEGTRSGLTNLGQFLAPQDREEVLRWMARMTPNTPVGNRELLLHLPGNRRAWWVWTARGMFDDSGQLIEVQAVGRDDTEIHDAREQLYQGAKMATLGEMATGLAHEMNQPLTVMRMALTNLVKRLAKDDLSTDYLQEKLTRLESQVSRASRIVDHVRIFGRRSESRGVLFDPCKAVVESVALTSEGMEQKGIELKMELLPVSEVTGHHDRLEQVLINLLLNAQYAVSQRAAREPEHEPWVKICCWETKGRVFITVEDNGDGIGPGQLTRIFEPFVTTKPVGEGTGLGLSVSYGIITQMGGELSVENHHQGARFLITLPIGQT